MNTQLPPPPPLVRLRDTLTSAAIRHDQACHARYRRSGNGYWNPYALPQYLARIGEIVADIERGADPRAAICAGFNGRLLQVMLRASGMGNPTDAEARGTGWGYVPASGASGACGE